jgi:hypothetical protein
MAAVTAAEIIGSVQNKFLPINFTDYFYEE